MQVRNTRVTVNERVRWESQKERKRDLIHDLLYLPITTIESRVS